MSKRSQALDTAYQSVVRLQAAGRLAEAAQGCRRILDAAPGHADSMHMLGVLALQTGRPADALAYFGAAIERSSRSALYHANRANALLALGRAAEAEAACRDALRHQPAAAEAWATLGHALSDQARAPEAVAAYREALRRNPRLPDLHTALGLALHDMARLEDAADALAEAARRAPGDPVAENNLASVLKDLGRLDEAEARYRAVLVRAPGDVLTHFNLGILLLLAGRTAEAWPEWDWRFRAEPATDRHLSGAEWQGEPLAGRTLLVHAEQGIGDMLQFARFVPLLPRDGRVILEVHAPLVRLLEQLPGVAQVVPLGAPLPRFDLRCAMMSLPGRLPIAATADRAVVPPYLAPDPAAVAAWRARLAGLPGRRVGLVWAGNPERFRMDRRRSVPPALLAPLAAVPGISWISLQKPAPTLWPFTEGPADGGRADGAAPDVSSPPNHDGPPVPRLFDPSAELADFADTAALVAALDLVIGVDTAVVHLAGALGRPVWLLNRFDTDWRWGRDRVDSPWYPTLRQFRQPHAGDWESVIAAVAAALDA